MIYIIVSRQQVYYINDLLNGRNWKIIGDFSGRARWDFEDTNSTMNNEVPMLEGRNSSNYFLTVELRNLECINLIREDEESKAIDDVPLEEKNVNEYINDTETLEGDR